MHPSRPLALAITLALTAAGASADSFTGPQSSQSPYVVPTADGWEVTSLVTVGDSAKESPYVMVGHPRRHGCRRRQVRRRTAPTLPTRPS